MEVERLKQNLIRRKESEMSKGLLSTGSTMLNLACSGKPEGGYPVGGYVFLVGDSMSGKTWFSLTCLAEAVKDPRFKNYRFIYDNVERGARMNMVRYFGQKMVDRLEPPRMDKEGEPVYSQYVEEFYFNVDDALDVAEEEGRPCIYIEDSMDGLDSFADDDKFEEWKEAFHEGKEFKGTYGMSKAKANSTSLRRLIGRLERTGSILIIISQTRDDVNSKLPFATKTRAGGKALRFYADIEIWSSVTGAITKEYRGKKRTIGQNVKLQVKKSRLTGKQVEVVVPIYHSFGIDDIGSCIDFLVSEKEWTAKKGVITASIGPHEFSSRKEKLIREIEDKDLMEDVQELVGECWDEIIEATAISRKVKYE